MQSQYFNNLHDLTQLSEGFANANTVASSNPDPIGFENYDLFSFFIGTSLGFALPALSASQFNALGSVANSGDVYAGLGTGGIAGQLGINTSRFLVRNLYLSLKFGYFNLPGSSLPGLSNVSGNIQQMLLGVGANYRILMPWGLWGGLLKWRGISLGTGLEYSRESLNASIDLQSPPESPVTVGPATATASLNNPQATLAIVSSSFIVPVELDTSIQLLWIFNLGFGVGADINLPYSTISIGGNGTTSISVTGAGTYTETPGSVLVNATDSKNSPGFWDYVSPKLSMDLGFDISIVKIDMPVEFYPLTKALSFGILGGVAW
ncbi:MAG: hypothetical protein ACLQMF_03435 [Rectinemataceae bacterium]